VDNLTEK